MAALGCLPGHWPPFVVTSHGADLFALRSASWRVLKRFVVRRAAAVTVVSSAMLEPVRQLGVDPAKLSVQSMGVDLRQRFHTDPAVAREPRRLLFVGRLVAKKGVQHLLEAMPRLVAAKPGLRLDIVGFGPDEAALRGKVGALGLAGCVDFVGAVPQAGLPERYRRASVFVAPFVVAEGGDQEGLGLVLVEAAGCGCPVVAGDVAAVRDVVDNPRIGTVLDPTDPARLAAAILAVLEGDAATPANAVARAAAVARFDWAVRAEAYAGLLEGCSTRSHQRA
jgi:glycosyltransferase involved in cell wall biosynthesis